MDTCSLRKMPKPYSGEKEASSTNGTGLTGGLHVEEYKIDAYLSLRTKLKSKWIKGLPHKSRYTESNTRDSVQVGNTLKHIGTGENFLNRVLMSQALR